MLQAVLVINVAMFAVEVTAGRSGAISREPRAPFLRYRGMTAAPDFDTEVHKLERRLPRWAGRVLHWAHTSPAWVRLPIAVLLIAGGALSFLPVLGLWMAPLGLALMAEDVPFLRPPMARLFAWINRKLRD